MEDGVREGEVRGNWERARGVGEVVGDYVVESIRRQLCCSLSILSLIKRR